MLFNAAGVTILVDPWLQGDLVFGGQTWLYRGQKGRLDKAHLDIDKIMAEADVVLLSQVNTVHTCSLKTGMLLNDYTMHSSKTMH